MKMLLDGILLVTPAPNPPHEVVVLRLREALSRYLGERAHVFARGAVQIPPRNHLEPDLLVMPAFRSVPRTWANLPDLWLAVEISGPHSRVYDRDFKHHAYRRLGVQTVWRVDLRDRTVTRSSGESGETVTTAMELVWHAPGFDEPLRIAIPPLFDGIDDEIDWDG